MAKRPDPIAKYRETLQKYYSDLVQGNGVVPQLTLRRFLRELSQLSGSSEPAIRNPSISSNA